MYSIDSIDFNIKSPLLKYMSIFVSLPLKVKVLAMSIFFVLLVASVVE
jgi:hypothetical protein